MKITVTHSGDATLLAQLAALVTAVNRNTDAVNTLIRQGVKMALDPTVQAEFDKLTADVTAQTTVVGSVETLLSGLSAQLAALKAQVGNPANTSADIIAAITNLEASIPANTAALSQAVAANTPASS